MELRAAQFAHRVEYFIDAASESGEMLSTTALALNLYGDPAVLADVVVDRPPVRIPPDVRAGELHALITAQNGGWSRDAINRRLEDIAAEITAQLPFERQAALHALGVLHMRHVVDGHAEYLAHSLYGDMTRGGNLWGFRRQYRCSRLTQEATPKVMRKMMAPRFIRRAIATYSDETRRLRDQVRRHMSRAIDCMAGQDLSGTPAEIRRALDDLDAVRRTTRLAETETWRGHLIGRGGAAKPPGKNRIRKNRKVIKRASKTAAALLGADTVSRFARGEKIVLPGADCALVVRLRGRLHELGHGRIEVMAQSHAGEPLADLCVYFNKTPALDQLTAFALHTQSGIEGEILKAANIRLLHPAGAASQLLASHRPRPAAGQLQRDDWALQQAREAEYWKASQHLWLPSLNTYLFGRTGPIMSAIADHVAPKTERHAP